MYVFSIFLFLNSKFLKFHNIWKYVSNKDCMNIDCIRYYIYSVIYFYTNICNRSSWTALYSKKLADTFNFTHFNGYIDKFFTNYSETSEILRKCLTSYFAAKVWSQGQCVVEDYLLELNLSYKFELNKNSRFIYIF